MSLIELQEVSFAYNRLQVLHNISLEIEQNSFWTIIGPNGAGKSTLLGLVSNNLHPQSGKILLENKRLHSYSTLSLARRMSLVRQEFAPAFGYRVFETVLMGRFGSRKAAIFETKDDYIAVQNALEATDTADLADRPISNLSGGERQRVFIARALAQETDILLLDEPTNHLDLKHQVRIFDLLKQMQLERGKTIILVTHDLNIASQYADRMLLLGKQGKAVSGKPREILVSGYVKSAFNVDGFYGQIEKENFFIPLGSLSRDKAAPQIEF